MLRAEELELERVLGFQDEGGCGYTTHDPAKAQGLQSGK